MISLIDKNALKVLAEDFTRAENLSESAARRLLLTLQVAFRLGQTDEQNLATNSVSTSCEDRTGYFGRMFVAMDHEPNPCSSIGIAYANSEVAIASVNSDHCCTPRAVVEYCNAAFVARS